MFTDFQEFELCDTLRMINFDDRLKRSFKKGTGSEYAS